MLAGGEPVVPRRGVRVSYAEAGAEAAAYILLTGGLCIYIHGTVLNIVREFLYPRYITLAMA